GEGTKGTERRAIVTPEEVHRADWIKRKPHLRHAAIEPQLVGGAIEPGANHGLVSPQQWRGQSSRGRQMTAKDSKHLSDETLGCPVSQRDKTAGLGHTDQLMHHPFRVWSEHHTIHAHYRIEARVRVGHGFGVAFGVLDVE